MSSAAKFNFRIDPHKMTRTSVKWLWLAACLSLSSARSSAQDVDFSHEIVPILKERCGQCHTGPQKKGGYSINTRETALAGGESGVSIVPGESAQSEFYYRITSDDAEMRMPPDGQQLSKQEIELLVRWIDQGATWEAGFTFGERLHEPPLLPRKVELPPVGPSGNHNPIDRILEADLRHHDKKIPALVDDATFIRRVYLDLIGLLPTPEEQAEFQADASSDKRAKLIRNLLTRNVDYAEHWLTFWNDLLRNDYTGTGFITGGRKQISSWLYDALVSNKPYDQFARELIAPPTPESAGFADGIRWRGEVSAGQTVEIQFAQSVGQSFLGINLKCASCHDSFIDRWTLDDAYGLAAIYSDHPLELHRCDKPIGKMAKPAWLFPQLGQVDPALPREERLRQLAELMTHRDNGRFTRTIVNRLWHRLMGRGIVHPTDAMQSPPYNQDLLDFLAEDLAEHQYDLKRTLELIATSAAYQSVAEVVVDESDVGEYVYAGPRSKRLTAEQFMDCVWQVTGTAPATIDAPVTRGERSANQPSEPTLEGQWIWNRSQAMDAAAGETVTFRANWELAASPASAVAIVTCDNSFSLYVNGNRVATGDNWESPQLISLTQLQQGNNRITIVGKNGGNGPNPAGLFFQAVAQFNDLPPSTLASNANWHWTSSLPDEKGELSETAAELQPAAEVEGSAVWSGRLSGQLASMLKQGESAAGKMVRASLVKSDFLMRSLGRPNRDQIVTVRPLELTTLEAIDLSNGEELASLLRSGAERMATKHWKSTEEFIDWLYQYALSRPPTSAERDVLTEAIGDDLSPAAIEDILWAVMMLPEFQLVR